MFKSKIVLNVSTDVNVELQALDDRARNAGLSEAETAVLIADVKSVLHDLQARASESAAVGIALHVNRTVESKSFQVEIDADSGSGNVRREGLIDSLFNRRRRT